MLDISPEKLVVLFVLAMVVLGPDKLPAAGRSLARSISRARQLASTLTAPITATLTEPARATFLEPLKSGLADPIRADLAAPRQAIDDAVAALRTTIAEHPLPGPGAPSQPPPEPSLN